MRRPVSTPSVRVRDLEVLLQAGVLAGVVGNAVLPAAPEHAGPGASEGADGSGVVVPAASRGGVFVLGPGVVVAGRVGEGAGGGPESVVTAAAEARDFFAAGFDGDGAHAGVGGEMVSGWVARAAVADLCQQGCGADHVFGVLEERQEDVPVGVRVDGVRDFAGQQTDLLDNWSECRDQRENESSAGVGFALAGASGRGVMQPSEQLGAGAPSVVPVTGQELGVTQAAGIDGAGIAIQERKADRAVEIFEDQGGAGPEALQFSTQLVAQGDALLDQDFTTAGQRAQRFGLIADRELPLLVLIDGLSSGLRPVAACGSPTAGTNKSHAGLCTGKRERLAPGGGRLRNPITRSGHNGKDVE
jgi:hypothetical protein